MMRVLIFLLCGLICFDEAMLTHHNAQQLLTKVDNTADMNNVFTNQNYFQNDRLLQKMNTFNYLESNRNRLLFDTHSV